MIPNTAMTLYRKEVDPITRTERWSRIPVPAVFWDESKAANVIKSGMLEADKVTVYVFDLSVTVEPGDVMVRGAVLDNVDPLFTMTHLRAKYPRSAVVTSVDIQDRGSLNLRHLQIGGK